MIRLSIPVRQALSRLTLPVLIAAAFGVMLLGKADGACWPSAPAWRWPTRWRRSTASLAEPLASVHGAMFDNSREPADRLQRQRTSACARRTSACAAGTRSPWRSTPRTPALKANLQLDSRSRPASYVTAPRGRRRRRHVCPRRAAIDSAPTTALHKGPGGARRTRGLVGRVTELGTAQRPRAADDRPQQPHPGDRSRPAAPAPCWSAPTAPARG